MLTNGQIKRLCSASARGNCSTSSVTLQAVTCYATHKRTQPWRRTPMNDVQTLSERADALEEKMSRELDYIVVKSRLYSLAEADLGPAVNANAIMAKNPNARVLMGDDPRLPAM